MDRALPIAVPQLRMQTNAYLSTFSYFPQTTIAIVKTTFQRATQASLLVSGDLPPLNTSFRRVPQLTGPDLGEHGIRSRLCQRLKFPGLEEYATVTRNLIPGFAVPKYPTDRLDLRLYNGMDIKGYATLR
jgi:hypothetical protein